MAKPQFMFDITEANKVSSGDNMVIWTQGVPRQEQEERETAGQQDSRPAELPVIKKRSIIYAYYNTMDKLKNPSFIYT